MIPIHLRKIGEIYKEVINEVERPFTVMLVGKDGVGKSELAAWFLAYNDRIDDHDIAHLNIIDIDSGHESLVEVVVAATEADLIIFVVDGSTRIIDYECSVWKGLKAMKKPLVFVVNKTDLMKSKEIGTDIINSRFNIGPKDSIFVSAKEGTNVIERLIPKVARLAKDFEIVLARKMPVFKEAVADRLVKRTAAENSVIGVAVFIPGADTPILTANQIRMVMKLALVHDQDIDFERIKEIIATLGSALVFRTVARTACGYVPVLGWAIKGGIAYGGTIALGKAVDRYFEIINHSDDGIKVESTSVGLLEKSKGQDGQEQHVG